MDAERIKFLAKVVEALEKLKINIENYHVYFGEKQEYVKDNIFSDFAIKGRYLSLSELEWLQDYLKEAGINVKNIYYVPGRTVPTQNCSGYLTGNLGWMYYLIERE